MKLKQTIQNAWTTNDRAVSPVIGVILMVAITVILAAVIGTFVLDLGQSVGQTGPTASLSVSDADVNYDQTTNSDQDVFVIEHQGGDEFSLETTKISIRNASNNNVVLQWDGTDGKTTETGVWTVNFNNNDITSGSTETMASGDILVLQANPDSNDDPADGTDYKILITDTESSSTVAQATIELR